MLISKSKREYMAKIKKQEYIEKYGEKAWMILRASKSNTYIENYPLKYRNDKDVMLVAVKTRPENFVYLSTKLRMDEEIWFEIIKKNDCLFSNAPSELKNNKSFVEKAVEISGGIMFYANKNFLNDKDIVLKAIKNNKRIFGVLPDNLRKAKEVIYELEKEIIKNKAYHLDLYNLLVIYKREDELNKKIIEKNTYKSVKVKI